MHAVLTNLEYNMFLLRWLNNLGELLFIALGMASLPLWFPILAIWTVVDLPHWWRLRKSARQNERALRQSASREELPELAQASFFQKASA